jgi:S1-C subfamily serine protease
MARCTSVTVILEIDGKAIDTAKELNAALEKYHVGDTVKLRIVRDGQQQDLSVVLRASQ